MEKLTPKYYLIIYIVALLLTLWLFVDAYWAFSTDLFVTQKMALIAEKKRHYWYTSMYLFFGLLLVALIFSWAKRIRLYFVLVFLYAFIASGGYTILLQKGFLFKITSWWNATYTMSFFMSCVIPTVIAGFIVNLAYNLLPKLKNTAAKTEEVDKTN